jgi:DnaJ-class molecular chaperone
MATRSTYECQNCHNQFDATMGNLRKAKEFRCVACDAVQYVPYSEVEDFKNSCQKCNGQMDILAQPMCPQCKGRDAKAVKLLAMID